MQYWYAVDFGTLRSCYLLLIHSSCRSKIFFHTPILSVTLFRKIDKYKIEDIDVDEWYKEIKNYLKGECKEVYSIGVVNVGMGVL